jgi:hypothetical protein
MRMINQAIILTFYVVAPGATVRVTAVPRIAVRTCPRTAAAPAAFGSVSAWIDYNDLLVLDLGLGSRCFATILSRLATELGTIRAGLRYSEKPEDHYSTHNLQTLDGASGLPGLPRPNISLSPDFLLKCVADLIPSKPWAWELSRCPL